VQGSSVMRAIVSLPQPALLGGLRLAFST